MFEKEAGNFDAVMIGTPDHTHYPATVRALNAGKHVFTQKPLTRTVWEARQLAEAVDKYKLATQMGNQGHANEGNRLIASYVQGGHLGDITEIHCFTNRPIWPQGFGVYWYDGTDNEYIDKDGKSRRHPRLEELAEGSKLTSSGNIYVGTKAKLLVSGDYGDSSRIIPETAHRALAAKLKDKTGSGRPARVYEKSIGHHTEWREAAIGNKPYDYPGSNFKYAGPFTETIQLGNVCLHHPGESLAWDGPSLRFTNNDKTNELINKGYSEGWDFKLNKA